MAIDFHSDDLDPDAVGRREFTRSRRGFDQIEVRAFLNAVAAQLRTERQRQVDLTRKLADAEARATRGRASDAQRLTTVLGEETARIIDAAREAAEEMRERAETETAQLQEEASRRLAEAKDEAEATLAAAQADAVAARDQATTEAMAEVEQAKDRAREMVEEAHAHRERVMHDVARRRKGLRAQYQTLAGVRDQMLERLDASQGLLGGAIEEVRRALNEDAPLVHPVEPPDEIDTGHADTADPAALDDEERIFHRVRTPAPPASEDATVDDTTTADAPSDADPLDEGDEGTTVEDATVEDGPSDDVTAEEVTVEDAATDDAATVEDGPSDDVTAGHVTAEDATTDDGASAEATTAVEDASIDDGSTDVSAGDDEVDPEAEEVDQLFAKLRAESIGDESGDADTTDAAAGDAEPVEVDVRDEATDADADEPEAPDPRTDPFGARDQALAPIDRTLQRQLKRVLADDQNGVLDRLRTLRGKPTAERVLSELDDVSRTAGEVSAGDLIQAYGIGVDHIGGVGGDATAVSTELARAYEGLIVEPLRAAVTALLEVSDDVDELSEQVRATYRTFRTEQLGEVSAHLVAAAYARGRYDAIDADTEVVWLQDPEASSPDCEDNELAGVVTKGTVFPTGSECAPAYEGCRCLVIPAALAPAPTEA